MINHYDDVIMGTMASQITSLAIVYSTVYSGADQRKHQSSASLAFVRGIHRRPVNSPHKWPVTRKMFPFDDVIINECCTRSIYQEHEQIVTPQLSVRYHFWYLSFISASGTTLLNKSTILCAVQLFAIKLTIRQLHYRWCKNHPLRKSWHAELVR